MRFVTCTFGGRMGNQLFEICATIAHALKYQSEYYFRTRFDGGDAIYFCDLPEFDPLVHKVQAVYKEKGHEYHPIRFMPDCRLEGYYQSEKYFLDFRKEILEVFDWPHEIEKGLVSLHIRRTDYLTYPKAFPPCAMDYYDQAIKYFKTRGYEKFLVFSDDIPWCKESLKQDVDFEFSEGLMALPDVQRMSQCEHHIIANSTFSWWGAWMNRNPDKLVVSPSYKNWFGPQIQLKTHDIIPASWLQIQF